MSSTFRNRKRGIVNRQTRRARRERADCVYTLMKIRPVPAGPALQGGSFASQDILAHTSSQTMSHRDLSLRSSRRLVPSAAIAWSRAWRPCATPNMTVPSSRWSPDRSSFCIVIFAASRTLAVRFQCSGAPQASSSCLVCTRRTCSAAVLAVQPIRPAWCEGKFCSQRIRPVRARTCPYSCPTGRMFSALHSPPVLSTAQFR